MGRQLRVGIFVLLGLSVLGVAIFLIGDSRKFWEAKVQYRAAFNDVGGLKPGSPVRMGGLDIGTVTAVGHADTVSDTRIYVSMSVVKGESTRVRENTVARVAGKGFLGDKMIEFLIGDGPSPPQDPAKLMKSEEPKDMFAQVNELANRAQKVVDRIEPLAAQLGDPKFSENIKGSAESLNSILTAIANKDSVAHRLLYDAEEAKKFDQALTNFSQASGQLNNILADVRDVTQAVKTGPGIAHAAIYDGEMSKNAAGTLAEVHQDLKAIREGNGIGHVIVYGDDKSQHIMGNLSVMSDDLRTITANLRQGKGTLGALLVDPSVYEDIKSAIGNVERNQVLRALVRYSIKADESKPHVAAPEPTPAPAPPK